MKTNFPWTHFDADMNTLYSLDECEVCGKVVEAPNSMKVSGGLDIRILNSLTIGSIPAEGLYWSDHHDAAACYECCQADFD